MDKGFTYYKRGNVIVGIDKNMYGDMLVEIYLDMACGWCFVDKYISWRWTELEAIDAAVARVNKEAA